MPDTVAFDVIGTLLSLDRARAALTSVGAPDNTLPVWFGTSLRDYFAISHAGDYAPFAQVLKADLRRALKEAGVDPTENAVNDVMGSLGDLDLNDGAEDAFKHLSGAGFQIVTLTNGSAEFTRTALERHGLEEGVAHVLSCDDVRVSKPHPRVYELAQRVSDGDVWMVASHAWDIAGAALAGLRTAFVGERDDYPDIFPAPEIVASDLRSAAERIVAVRKT
jgi:2-haloacid dehalogenase